MKVSVSLPADDVEFLDNYASAQNIVSRSAVLHRAVRLLRATELGSDYEGAWAEWRQSEADDEWSTTLSDGITQ